MSDDDLIRKGDALYAIAGWEIPSTAIAALPAVTVGVKPLVWTRPRKLDEGGAAYDAHTTCGQYIATDTGWFLVGRSGWLVATSLETAKAAAQADYEARILAALEPVTAPAPDALLRCAECSCDDGNCTWIATDDDIYPYDAIEQCERDLDGVDAEAAPDAAAIREAALREAAEEAEYFANKDLELRLTRADGTPVQRLTTEQAMREIRNVARHISHRILALLTEKPHDRA